jgi:anthranilate synthase/phosphoribosyltransferase
MYLIIDNYDSFTYNIFQYMTELTDKEIKVVRNNRITVEEIENLDPEGIIISPGPGRPEDAGISLEAVKYFAGQFPILGVCLGHQVIGEAFGANIIGSEHIVHGKTETISLDGKGLFRTLSEKEVFTRYHSLIIDPESLPACFEISASGKNGEIMGVRHLEYDIESVQFHPESIGSPTGRQILANFINYRREPFPVKQFLVNIIDGNDLSFTEAENFMTELTEGGLNNSQIAAFLTSLNCKGITGTEIAGCASALQKKRTAIKPSLPVLDTCGTGGDGLGTFNISSFSALIAASCGVPVAKHGNRAVSSLSGSAEFYSELGLDIYLSPTNAIKLLENTNFTFLFAPTYHGAMRYAAPVRKDLGIKTIMNLLGPLVNPAGAEYQIIGVYADEYCMPVAEAAKLLGIKKAAIVHGFDGLDEISVSGPSRIVFLNEDGTISDSIFNPGQYGIPIYDLSELKGGEGSENAAMAVEIMDNRGSKAIRDASALNAGAGLYLYGIADSIQEGYKIAIESLKSGRVSRKIEEIINVTKGMKL